MSDEGIPTSVTYNYHTYTTTGSSGGPLFILLYIQCAMLIVNKWLSINMELWQLIFPTFLVGIVLFGSMLSNTFSVNK